MKNLSGLRSKSIDKTSGGPSNQKFNQHQFMQQLAQQNAAGQVIAKKQTATMYNGLVQGISSGGGNNGGPSNNPQMLYQHTGQPIVMQGGGQGGSQLSAIGAKRANAQMRKRVTSDVHMIAI